MGIIEAAWHYLKLIIAVVLGAWAIWWCITHPDSVAAFIMAIINFFKTLFSAIAGAVF